MARETYPLRIPLVIKLRGSDGKEREEAITSLDLDFPDDGVLRARHLVATDGEGGEVGKTLALISLFSGQPRKVVDELSEGDFIVLYEMVDRFTKPGRATGATSSQTSE